MTSEEIRKLANDCDDGENAVDIAKIVFMSEIAAQLADLNQYFHREEIRKQAAYLKRKK